MEDAQGAADLSRITISIVAIPVVVVIFIQLFINYARIIIVFGGFGRALPRLSALPMARMAQDKTKPSQPQQQASLLPSDCGFRCEHWAWCWLRFLFPSGAPDLLKAPSGAKSLQVVDSL